ncbi:MAG TPA: DUF4363 family protein [Bacillota bacterium]|nr:DUF4363 family protein [Bacillota bacterium]HPL54236.1 DUF4363 family protein [Bacillota bacterium]
MRPLIIIIVLALLVVTGGCLTLNALNSESQRLSSNLEELEQHIEKQNWDEASKKLQEFREKWDKVSTLWTMLIDHYEIDNIELILSRLVSYAKNHDKVEALSEMSSLKTLIKHIPDKESFSLKNIF